MIPHARRIINCPSLGFALLCAAIVALLVTPPPALADPQPPALHAVQPAPGTLPRPIATVLAQLNDKTFTTRQQITAELLADKDLTLANIHWLIEHSKTPEQRNRLITVARHHYLRQVADRHTVPHGAGFLGLTHQSVPANALPWLKHDAIRVLATVPGFPACGQLQPGDIILGFDGQTFNDRVNALTFKDMIQKHSAGDKVTLRIFRRGEKRTVTLELGSAAAEQRMYTYQNQVLRLTEPYRQHWLDVRHKLRATAPLDTLALETPPASQPH